MNNSNSKISTKTPTKTVKKVQRKQITAIETFLKKVGSVPEQEKTFVKKKSYRFLHDVDESTLDKLKIV